MNGREVVLVRHGETEWSRTGQHTSRTDLPLTGRGAEQATAVGTALANRVFTLVLTSPRRRAVETCELAGFGTVAERDDDITEWDYGSFEGRTTAEIRAEVPGWSLWTDGCPGGESPGEVAARVDRAIARLRAVDGPAAVFAHGHLLRVLAARWVGLPVAAGQHLALDPATVSRLSTDRDGPVIERWNVPV